MSEPKFGELIDDLPWSIGRFRSPDGTEIAVDILDCHNDIVAQWKKDSNGVERFYCDVDKFGVIVAAINACSGMADPGAEIKAMKEGYDLFANALQHWADRNEYREGCIGCTEILQAVTKAKKYLKSQRAALKGAKP